MMRAALALARRSLGRTWPNPAVGCVIVKDGRVVARGRTQDGGRPHAEAEALGKAGDAAQRRHGLRHARALFAYGKTPPCADALIAAGVARVVSAIEDPDPRGEWAGPCPAARRRASPSRWARAPREAAEINAGFLLRVQRRPAAVHLKLATSLDGRIATASGESKWITGEARAPTAIACAPSMTRSWSASARSRPTIPI